MPAVLVSVSTAVARSPRVQQIEGLFDLQPREQSTRTWDVNLPLDDAKWNVGLIVGPSGSGKSTIARHLWPEECKRQTTISWSATGSVIDGFPASLGVKEIVALLSSVGFSSPPDWLKPFGVLSTGQQFRALVARLLAENAGLTVIDEFTSTVDRTVAQVGSAAVAKSVRQRDKKLVAVTCHEDVEAWLQPDWVYRPAEGHFARRCLQRRPAIALEVFRCSAAAWPTFRHHHYLSHDLNRSAVCFLACWLGRAVAFSAWLPMLGARCPTRREHRTVTLPDYQGVGIGHALSTFCASLWKAQGYRATSTTTHPAFIASRRRDVNWKMTRPPGFPGHHGGRPVAVQLGHAYTRLTAGFEYVGPAMDKALSARLLQTYA